LRAAGMPQQRYAGDEVVERLVRPDFKTQESLQFCILSFVVKLPSDAKVLAGLASEQRGVFSTKDLEVALQDRHPASFARRVRALLEAGVLRRFLRGWYVADTFDLPTLSQRLAPASYISFGNVLARRLLIGTSPQRQVMAARVGRSRRYRALGYEIVHLSIAAHLDFGHCAEEGVDWADSEKALLDVLFFHLRGQRYVFDPFSDIDLSRLDRERIDTYLERYRNPKFVTFVEGVLS